MRLSHIKKDLSRWKRKLKWVLSLARSWKMLKRRDNKFIPSGKNELRLFTMARNESLRLPFFFNYYFERGVDRIFLIDNNSTDDTLNIAGQRPNVHVYQTRESFKKYYNWMEILLQKHGVGHWCVAADIDEYLIYPQSENISIQEFAVFLEQKGFTAFRCLLLDMYAESNIQTISYKKGENPIHYTPYFDPAFDKEERILYNEKFKRPFATIRYSGGMRKRLFGIDPNQTKIPLFKYNKNIYTVAGMHAIDGAKIADLQGVVLHFKYLQDFVNRSVEETERKQHANSAALYKSISNKLQNDHGMLFHYDGSLKYENSGQLVELGLMKSTLEYEAFCKKIVAADKGDNV